MAEQISGNSIKINSMQEFNELIEDFPDDPAIHKAHADFLIKKKSSDKTALSYSKAAALYLKSGKLLPAVLTKLLQWRIKSPVLQDAQLAGLGQGEVKRPICPCHSFELSLSPL